MRYKKLIVALSIGALSMASWAEPKKSAQADADGSADSYLDKKSGELAPEIRKENGHEYYYWPGWNKSKNQKLQVRRERTTHPDAQWWPEAGLGIFMHWGIVSEFEPTGEAWAGRWTPDREKRGEFHPQQEIWDAAKTFNPTKYDAEKWMAGAKRAGFKYAVLTTKHHDGYALWDSDYALIGVRQYLDGWDLVEPFVKACRNNDLKVGFYYSGMDWYFIRDYMNFSFDPNKKMNFKGEWVKTLPKEPQHMWAAYCDYNEAQVKELITKFDPDIWWGDGGHGASVESIRKMRPGIVCNNRDPASGDHATAEGFGMSDPKFIKPILENGWWWEVNSIIQKGSWHYDARGGEEIYPSDEVLRKFAEARCMGGNLLANIGPRPDGTYQDQVWRLFDDMEEWMKTNEEAVFGINGGGPWPEKCNVPITAKDRTWYFHARDHEATSANPVVLTDCAEKPKAMTLLNTGDKILFTYKKGTLTFSIPEKLKARNITDVVKVEFGNNFDPKPFLFKHW